MAQLMLERVMICIGCERIDFSRHGLCRKCTRALLKTRLDAEEAMILKSLFYYEPPVKDLILAAKIAHSRLALRFLTSVFARSPLLRDACARSDLIMPAPSSLWSRYHGRLDLASELAHAAGTAYGLPVIAAPWHLGWDLRKQAHRKARFLAGPRRRVHLDNRRILLVDDVKTSGATLRRLEAALDAGAVESATLARTKSS